MSINEALNILGLNSNFSEKELKRAYYALVKKYHPDQFEKSDSNVKIKAAEELKIINLAYEQLLEYKKFLKIQLKYMLICYPINYKFINLI